MTQYIIATAVSMLFMLWFIPWSKRNWKNTEIKVKEKETSTCAVCNQPNGGKGLHPKCMEKGITQKVPLRGLIKN